MSASKPILSIPDEGSLRIMAHSIVYNGIKHPLSIATISRGGHGWDIDIKPFAREIHSTTFVNGTIMISLGADGKPLLTAS